MQRILLIFCLFITYSFCFEERTVILGPITIEANDMNETYYEAPDWISNLEDPLSMNNFYVKIKDLDGNELTQSEVYLHHLLISADNVRNIPCPEFGGWNFVGGAGAELTTIDIPYPYAYKINPGDEWDVALHVVNPSKHNSVTFNIEYTMNIGNWTDDLIEVEGYLHSATGCDDDLDFDIDEDLNASSFIIHADFLSTFTGTFVWTAGHLHRGGKNVYLSRSSTGEILFSATAHYEDDHHKSYLTRIDSTINQLSMEIYEPLRITAVYDCSQDYEGAMGIIFGYAIINDYYEGDPPLKQLIEYDNPFPTDLQLIPETYEQSNAQGSYQSNSNITKEENTEDKAILGLLASIGLIVMFTLGIILVISVIILVRLKSKRSLEIFD